MVSVLYYGMLYADVEQLEDTKLRMLNWAFSLGASIFLSSEESIKFLLLLRWNEAGKIIDL